VLEAREEETYAVGAAEGVVELGVLEVAYCYGGLEKRLQLAQRTLGD